YARVKLLDHLPGRYRCIVFDRRECGASGGRVELMTWAHYARQGKLLLEHLGIERAHVMGGCMGCSCVMAFAVDYPQATASMLLWWPVGGAKYRIKAHERFAAHLAFVRSQGLQAVIVPGRDESHSTSAARYLEECLPKAQYWDVLPEQQTEANAPARLLDFLNSVLGT